MLSVSSALVLLLVDLRHGASFVVVAPSLSTRMLFSGIADRYRNSIATTSSMGHSRPTSIDGKPNSWLYDDNEEEDTPSLYTTFTGIRDDEFHLATRDLSRLAVAFSAHSLQLQDIHTVQLLGVDKSKIEIEAVVCEDDMQCVSLAVPVAFPTECAEEEDGECILHNLQQLESEAEFRIHHRQQEESTSRQNEDRLISWKRLTTTQDLVLPDWWVPAGSLQAACDDMVDILNRDDFQDEVRAMTRQQIVEKTTVISSAAVVSICPTGMCLRASLSDGSIRDAVVEFGGGQTGTGEALKSAVLAACTEGRSTLYP